MWLSVPTASELGSPPPAGESYNPLLWGIAICSQWEAPGRGPGYRRLQEAQASSPASYPLCCLEARRPGPEVIIKMENVVWPKDGASLMCLFAASARCTPTSFWRRLKKLSVQSAEKTRSGSLPPRHRLGRKRVLRSYCISPGACSVIRQSHLLGFGISLPFQG